MYECITFNQSCILALHTNVLYLRVYICIRDFYIGHPLLVRTKTIYKALIDMVHGVSS